MIGHAVAVAGRAIAASTRRNVGLASGQSRRQLRFDAAALAVKRYGSWRSFAMSA